MPVSMAVIGNTVALVVRDRVGGRVQKTVQELLAQDIVVRKPVLREMTRSRHFLSPTCLFFQRIWVEI
jgi:hypothetical protein